MSGTNTFRRQRRDHCRRRHRLARLRSENGELRSTATRFSQVSATSQSGKVDLSFAAVPRQVGVTTDNGEVNVTVPHAAYKVATTYSGDVRIAVPKDTCAARSSTDSGAIILTTAAGG